MEHEPEIEDAVWSAPSFENLTHYVTIPLEEFERLCQAKKERDEWEEKYEDLLAAVGGTWPG